MSRHRLDRPRRRFGWWPEVVGLVVGFAAVLVAVAVVRWANTPEVAVSGVSTVPFPPSTLGPVTPSQQVDR